MEPFSIQKPEWYESIYIGKDYNYESEYLLKIFNKNNKEEPVILDVGAGTGKLVTFLANKSSKYIALEPNKVFCEFMDKLYSSKSNFIIENSNFESYVKNPDKNINFIIANFNVVNYIEYENFLKLTNIIYKRLKRNSIFIFDSWSLEYVLNQKTEMNDYKIIPSKSIKKDHLLIRFSNSIFNKKESNIKIKFDFVKVNSNSMRKLGNEVHKIMPYSINKLIKDLNEQGWVILNINENKFTNYAEDVDFSSQRNWFLAIQKR